MTIGELIANLETMPKHYEVVIAWEGITVPLADGEQLEVRSDIDELQIQADTHWG